MRPFTAGELAGMTATQEGAMMDECVILTHTVTGTGPRGSPIVDYVPAAGATPCGLGHSKTDRELMGDAALGTQVAEFDGTLRLPKDTVINTRDRVRITKRFGVAVDPVVYEIVGTPRLGPSGLLGRVKRVTNGQ